MQNAAETIKQEQIVVTEAAKTTENLPWEVWASKYLAECMAVVMFGGYKPVVFEECQDGHERICFFSPEDPTNKLCTDRWVWDALVNGDIVLCR